MRRPRWSLVPLVALAGCTVGPHYRSRAPVPVAGGAFQAGLAVDPIGALPDRWWSLYADPRLDALVEEALAHNSDLRVAAANLERAQAVLQEQRASLLPTTEVTGGATYGRSGAYGSSATGTGTLGTSSGGTSTGGTGTSGGTGSSGGTGTTGGAGTGAGSTGSGGTSTAGTVTAPSTAKSTTIYRAGFALAYEVDLFGRVRRSIEAARADVASTEATRDAVRVTVAAATTQAYFDACLLGARVDVANQSLQLVSASYEGIRKQVRLGVGSPYDIARQGVLVEQTRAAGAQLDGLRAQALYDLTVLLGRPATQVPAAALACHAAPRLQRPIPIGDGAAMIARRPDIRSAERTLAGDTARIGVATADLFPTVTLGGSITAAGTGIKTATSRSGVSFGVGPLVSWFFPNIVAARARIREAGAQTRASLASFDGTVLTALGEVERALAAYDAEIRRNEALASAVAASQRAYGLALVRVRYGSISQLELIDVQRDLISTQSDLAASDATLGAAQVTVFRALGGGWQDAPAIDSRPAAVDDTAKP